MSGGRALAGIAARALLEQVGRARRLPALVRRGRDPGAVHDLRVASRRIRAALALLRAAGVPHTRAWRREVRRLARALGRARDLDVRLAFLRTFLRRARRKGVSLPPALPRLEWRVARERRYAQRYVLCALRRVERSGILGTLEAWARRAAPAADPHHPVARRAAARQIGQRLRALMELAPDIRREEAADRHHLLRIAAKRLRYTLEILRPFFGSPLEPRLGVVRRLQELLGDLHDCDLWVASLPAGDPAFGILRADRSRRRRALYRRLVRWWDAHRQVWSWLRRRAAFSP